MSTRRLVVLGATGSFGSTLREVLAEEGLASLAASRRPGRDLVCDAEDPASLQAALRPGDVVLDCAGPYQDRSLALAEAAAEVGFDVVDLADSLGYARALRAMDAALRAGKARLLTGQSSVSALAGHALRASRLQAPVRLTGLLVPASRETAALGSAASMLRSVGRPVVAYEGGEAVTRPGWSTTRELCPPRGEPVLGHLFETADLEHLPRAYPDLEEVAMFVTTNVAGLDAVLDLADKVPGAPGLIRALLPLGAPLAKLGGGREGVLAYEVEDAGGEVVRVAYRGGGRSRRVPVLPAALAARMLAEGRGPAPGLFCPARELDDVALGELLERHGVEVRLG